MKALTDIVLKIIYVPPLFDKSKKLTLFNWFIVQTIKFQKRRGNLKRIIVLTYTLRLSLTLNCLDLVINTFGLKPEMMSTFPYHGCFEWRMQFLGEAHFRRTPYERFRRGTFRGRVC